MDGIIWEHFDTDNNVYYRLEEYGTVDLNFEYPEQKVDLIKPELLNKKLREW